MDVVESLRPTSELRRLELYDLPKPVELAIRFGLVKPGYLFEDYLIEAVKTPQGYETVDLWGVQGSGKSTRMLQMLFWIFYELIGDVNRAWRAVLDHIIFKPGQLVERLEAVPDNEVLPCLGWDDIGVHFPNSKFKTDIKEYQAVDSTWAAIRTKVHVVIVTIPLINRLAKNVKDNVTFEVFLGKNQMEIINRVFHLPGTRSLDSNFFKVVIERPKVFDLYMVPKWVWKEYWAMRLKLTKEALTTLRGATDMKEEGYIPVLEGAALLKISPNTLQQMISRGVCRGRKIEGLLHVFEEDLHAIAELQTMKSRRRSARM